MYNIIICDRTVCGSKSPVTVCSASHLNTIAGLFGYNYRTHKTCAWTLAWSNWAWRTWRIYSRNWSDTHGVWRLVDSTVLWPLTFRLHNCVNLVLGARYACWQKGKSLWKLRNEANTESDNLRHFSSQQLYNKEFSSGEIRELYVMTPQSKICLNFPEGKI